MSQKELIKKFFHGRYENDEHGNLLCPCAHLSCDFRMTLIGDIINENEFDEFWLHVEEYHRIEYAQIIERCRSMILYKPKVTKVEELLHEVGRSSAALNLLISKYQIGDIDGQHLIQKFKQEHASLCEKVVAILGPEIPDGSSLSATSIL